MEEKHNKQFPNNPYRTMSSTTVPEEIENTMDLHREFISDRDNYSIWGIITFTLPILLIIIFYAIRWIWFTSVSQNNKASIKLAKSEGQQGRRLLNKELQEEKERCMPEFNEEIYQLIANGGLDRATKVYARLNNITITTRNFGQVQRDMAKLLDNQYGTSLKKIVSAAQTKSSLFAAGASLIAIFVILFSIAFFLDGVQGGSKTVVNFVVGAVAATIIAVVAVIYRRFKAKVYTANSEKLSTEIIKIRKVSHT